TALCRRVGWLEAPRQSGATTAIEWFYAYFALASAFFSAVAWPAPHCMRQGRLRKGGSLRCRCGEYRAYAREVVLLSRGLAPILLRWRCDAAPRSVSRAKQWSPSSKRLLFPSHIPVVGLAAAEMMPCDDRCAYSNSIPVGALQKQKCIRGWQLEKDTNCALVPDNSTGRRGDRTEEKLPSPTRR